MTPAGLVRTGRRLFGKRWKTALAKKIGVSVSTIHRWANGAPIKKPVVEYLKTL